VIRYAARAVPWPLVAAVCALAPVLMAIVAAWPESMWPLQGATIGLLAAAAAWSMDESAAAVVDSLPRSLRWRTAARATAVVPLALTWAGCILVAGDRLPPHAGVFLLQGAAALLFAVAVATWRRAGGSATPGMRLGSATVGIAAVVALVRPLPDALPLFPIWDFEAWTRSLVLWSGLAAGSAVLLAAALADRRIAYARGRWRSSCAT